MTSIPCSTKLSSTSIKLILGLPLLLFKSKIYEKFNYLYDLDLLILDSLRYSAHEAHLSVDQAVEISNKIKPKRTVLTHMSSELKYQDLVSYLPKNIVPGFDGMSIKI